MITPSGGDTIFAEWTCAGTSGRCHGKFTLSGGTSGLAVLPKLSYEVPAK
jgi:hypothetical protein